MIDIHEKNAVFRTHTDSSYNLGFSAAVLSLLPFGLTGDRSKRTNYLYKIKKVEGHMFLPSREYVRRSVSQPEVLRYLSRHWYRKSLFMIVGIKIGFNAEFTHQRENQNGGQFTGCVPGGIHVDFAGRFKHGTIDHRYERKRIPSSFVFAYRLREVRYFKKDNSTKDTEFTKGATLHDLYGSRYVTPCIQKDTMYLGTEDEIDIDGIG